MTTEVSLISGANDYFIANPSPKPKSAVAAYVESEGILAAPRFGTIKEAESWPHGFIIRSEHPLEYAGPSDMLASIKYPPTRYTRGDLAGFSREDWRSYQLDGGVGPNGSERQLIADAYGYKLSDYEDAIDFSVWGAIRGINRTIFADPANPERYFVGSDGSLVEGEAPARAFQAIDTAGGVETIYNEGFNGWPEEYGSVQDLIAYYKAIRGLSRFEPGHNPIIELQSDATGNQWFLQYHRGRKSGQSAFAFDDTLRGVPMRYAIGATHPDGEDLEVAIAFADGLSIAHPYAGVRTELLARADIPTMIVRDNLPTHFLQGLGAHASRSIWSKTPLALFIESSDSGATELLNNTRTREISPGVKVTTTQLHVVSNGREAFARI